ncbi:MAG: tetratricopeptide repeat protein [bacterium]
MGKRRLFPFGLYYVVLLTYLCGAFFPEIRIWGFNWWAYYPDGIQWGLFGIGAVAPAFALVTRWSRQYEADERKAASRGHAFGIFAISAPLLFGALFYILRVKTHFLGDGYTLLTSLAADHATALKVREIGESLAHIWLKDILPGSDIGSALLSYQIISILSGFVFVAATVIISTRLFPISTPRVLFVLGVCSGGYMLLYFGYVENYSLFLTAVGVYTMVGILAAESRVATWLILIPVAAAIFFHIFGVVLLPSAAYLILSSTRVGGKWRRSFRRTKALIVGLACVLLAVIFYHYYTTSYFFRFALVPVVSDKFTIEGYTLFSSKHLLDYLNLNLLLLPGLPIMASAAWLLWHKSLVREFWFKFSAILVLSVLGAVFVFDPRLGMPRDWDLFAFSGVPIGVASYYLLLSRSDKTRLRRDAVILSITLGALSLFPRVYAQNVPETAVQHVLNYKKLDSAKCRNAQWLLKEYYALTGDHWIEQIRQTHWKGTYEQDRLLLVGIDAMNEGNFSAAVSAFDRACKIDPSFWNAWVSLGGCYYELGLFDKALSALDIAEGYNPHSAGMLSNRAGAYTRLGKYGQAEDGFRRALEIDTSSIGPYVGLIRLYRITKQEALYRQYLMRATNRLDVPPMWLKELGDYMVSKGDFSAAADGYRRAMEKGLDSSYVRETAELYPQLKEEMGW